MILRTVRIQYAIMNSERVLSGYKNYFCEWRMNLIPIATIPPIFEAPPPTPRLKSSV